MKNMKLYDVKRFENIRDILSNSVKLYPNNVAFRIKHKDGKNVSYEDITYAQFQNEINELGTGLLKLGYKDKRVAIIGKNSYEWAVSYYSVINGLGVVIPLDKGLPEAEIELSLKRSKADVIIYENSYEDCIKRILENKTTDLKEAICMQDNQETKEEQEVHESEENIKNPEGMDNQNIKAHQENFSVNIKTLNDVEKIGKEELEKGNNAYINAEIDNKKMAAIIFTSGTTSLAKAVMLSHYNIASNIYSMSCMEYADSNDVNIAFLPFHHTFGSTGLTFFLSKGAMNVFCDGLRHVQDNLKEYHVTCFICVPLLLEAMYKKIMQQIEKQGKTKTVETGIKISRFLLKFGIDIRRKLFKEILDNLGGKLRFIVSGASAIDKKVAQGFNDFGILTVQGYGLTETSPVLCAENKKAIRYGSIGLPFPDIEIKIDNPNENGIGEIVAKGPNVMLGYYEDEDATKAVLKAGWFYTGDLGYIDKDGFIFIAGRQKNVIVLKNGKNVYPEELEILVNNLPYVEESMVFGMPKDDDLVVSVKIVYNENYVKEKFGDITEEELQNIIWADIKEINKGLAKYKYIKHLIITKEPMVKTTTAKVKRYEEMKKISE